MFYQEDGTNRLSISTYLSTRLWEQPPARSSINRPDFYSPSVQGTVRSAFSEATTEAEIEVNEDNKDYSNTHHPNQYSKPEKGSKPDTVRFF